MGKDYNLVKHNKIKSNYFKAIALVYFLINLFFSLEYIQGISSNNRLPRIMKSFPNITSITPIIVLKITIIWSGIIGSLLILIINMINNKVTNVENRVSLINRDDKYNYSNNEDSLLNNTKFIKKYSTYIKILSIFSFTISLALALYILKYYHLFILANPWGCSFESLADNHASSFLFLIMINLAFIIMILLTIICSFVNRVKDIEKKLIGLRLNKKLTNNIYYKINYIKMSIWLSFTSSIIIFFYFCTSYLKNTNFTNIKLAFIGVTSKIHVMVLASVILYIGISTLVVLLIVFKYSTKISSIKEYMNTLMKDKNVKTSYSNSSPNHSIKIFAWFNFIVSILLGTYIFKCFSKLRITTDLIQDRLHLRIINNPITDVLTFTIFHIGITVLLFLIVIYNIYKNVSFVEENIDMLNNKK